MEHWWADTACYRATGKVKNRLTEEKSKSYFKGSHTKTDWQRKEDWEADLLAISLGHLPCRRLTLSLFRQGRKGCQGRLNNLKGWLLSNLLWFRHFMWPNSQEPSLPWQLTQLCIIICLAVFFHSCNSVTLITSIPNYVSRNFRWSCTWGAATN